MLGLFEEAAYQTSEVKLVPRDMVMLFTDGLYEVQGRNDELYSQAMLVAGVQRRVQLPAPQLFDELLVEIWALLRGQWFRGRRLHGGNGVCGPRAKRVNG